MWPFPRRVEQRSTLSIGDPALAELLGFALPNAAGVNVNESTALGLSAVWRAVSLISGTVASLPLHTLREVDGQHERAASFLDDPGGDRSTPFEWTELVLLHLLLHGNAYLIHIYNGAGAISGLYPVHPLSVGVERADTLDGRLYRVRLGDGTSRVYDADELTHIPAMSVDGTLGMSPIRVARDSLGTGIAGNRSAAKAFGNGALISGLVTPEDDLPEEEAKEIKAGLRAKITGTENAGDIVLINRKLKFTPWMMTLEDAQFLQSRAFEVEEVARWFGVPPHLLAQTEKQTSWGAGVAEQNEGLARYTLVPWTTRIEQRLSRLLPSPRWVEFDYTAFVRPSPQVEIPLLIQQVAAGLITPNEARKIRNMPPLPGGDVPRDPAAAPTSIAAPAVSPSNGRVPVGVPSG